MEKLIIPPRIFLRYINKKKTLKKNPRKGPEVDNLGLAEIEMRKIQGVTLTGELSY